jgi:mannose-6-phosphate isomerase-like protein (cupin superfamily)
MTIESDRVDIIAAALANEAYRREIRTGAHAQVVVMTIAPGDDIGEETHADTDQVLLFVDGQGEAELDGRTTEVKSDDLVLVPAGTRHNVRSVGEVPLRLVTVYAPPAHVAGTVHMTKADAAADPTEH